MVSPAVPVTKVAIQVAVGGALTTRVCATESLAGRGLGSGPGDFSIRSAGISSRGQRPLAGPFGQLRIGPTQDLASSFSFPFGNLYMHHALPAPGPHGDLSKPSA